MSPELADFVVGLARTVQRYSMYPAGHPARESTVKQLTADLEALLSDRGSLPLGISRDRLTIDGEDTDPKNALLAGFAGRLHEHQLISATFTQGIEEKEVAALLALISVPLGPTGQPIGAGPPEQLNLGPHIRLVPLSYDAISIAKAGAQKGGEKVVKGGAEAGGTATPTLQSNDAIIEIDLEKIANGSDADDQNSAALSTGIDTIEQDSTEQPDADLPGVTAALPDEEQLDDETMRQRISRLILNLDPQTLQEITKSIPEEALSGGLEGAVASAVADFIARAGSGTSDEPSAALLRTLTKMSMRGDAPSGPTDAETAHMLSRMVGQLSAKWQITDTAPQEYREQLREFSQDAPILQAITSWLEEPRAERIVQMGLEMDDMGATIRNAAITMTEGGLLNKLLDLLETPHKGSNAVKTLWKAVTSPEILKQIVDSEPPDYNSLDRIIHRLNSDTAGPIFDALNRSKSRTTRLGLLERLLMMGPKIGPTVVERLEDEQWHVRRNMLVILNHLPSLPEAFIPEPYLVDTNAQVRREAMQLVLANSSEPELTIVAALLDSDDQIIVLGLSAAEKECSPAVVPYIVKLVLDTKTATAVRLAAIQALSSSDSPEVLQTLLRLTWVRRSFILKGLAPKSSEMLQALAILVRNWAEDPRTTRVLRAASRAKDPQIRAVAKKVQTA